MNLKTWKLKLTDPAPHSPKGDMLTDLATAQRPRVFRGDALRIEAFIVDSGSIAGVTEMVAEVWSRQTNGDLLLSQSTAADDIDDSKTLGDLMSGAGGQVAWEWATEDTNFAVQSACATVWLSIMALWGNGDRRTVAGGLVEIITHPGMEGGDPVDPSGAVYTRTEADATFMRLNGLPSALSEYVVDGYLVIPGVGSIPLIQN